MFFKNEIIQQLNKHGFAVLDGVISNEIEGLSKIIAKSTQCNIDKFHYSLLENNYEQNIEIRRQIKQILQPFYNTHFNNHKTLNESFLIKPANTVDEFFLHQDFNYTDEKLFSAYNIWIPIADVTTQNGAMFFLSGSHRWFENYRSASLPTARISSIFLQKEQLTKVELLRGQALLFHPAVFHGSCPNLSAINRAVIATTIMPIEAPFVYYHQEIGSKEVNQYLLDEDAYLRDLNNIANGIRPIGTLLKQFPYKHQIVTEEQLFRSWLS